MQRRRRRSARRPGGVRRRCRRAPPARAPEAAPVSLASNIWDDLDEDTRVINGKGGGGDEVDQALERLRNSRSPSILRAGSSRRLHGRRPCAALALRARGVGGARAYPGAFARARSAAAARRRRRGARR